MVDKASFERVAKQWAASAESEIRSWNGFEDFKLKKLVLDWKLNRRSSRGGWYAAGPGINIAMSKYVCATRGVQRVHEYPSFDEHPVIGGFYTENTHLPLAMVVCHEMAHAAQFYSHIALKHTIDKPHGDSFRTPYSRLRTALLNHQIEKNQAELKHKFDNQWS